ncbi:MAG: hypothetical protein JEZ04_16035 [Spirochaetales bacterium]|nr:hypothetical protein [Spirochaetales bacterium]
METVEIILKGHLDREWLDFMNDISVEKTHEGTTIIRGHIKDQSALFSIFSRIRSLGVEILKVEILAGSGEDNKEVKTV